MREGGKLLSSRLEYPAVSGIRGITLPVSTLLGVRITVTDDQGVQMKANPRLFLEGGIVTLYGPQDIPPSKWLLDWEAALSGIPGSNCGSFQRNGFPLTVVVRNAQNTSSWGPIRVLVGRPGYSTASRLAYATAITDKIPEFVLQLTRKTDCWAAITVAFSNTPWSELFASSLPDWGGLTLLTPDGEEYALRFGALIPSSHSGIPCGAYLVSFNSGRAFWYPARGTTVPLRVDEQGATIDIDLTGAGALVVDLLDADGRELSDRATLRLKKKDNSLVSVSFPGPPYGIPAVEAGFYYLSAYTNARVPTGKEPYKISIEIRSGEMTAVILSPSN